MMRAVASAVMVKVGERDIELEGGNQMEDERRLKHVLFEVESVGYTKIRASSIGRCMQQLCL
jgi:hypothetical protein